MLNQNQTYFEKVKMSDSKEIKGDASLNITAYKNLYINTGNLLDSNFHYLPNDEIIEGIDYTIGQWINFRNQNEKFSEPNENEFLITNKNLVKKVDINERAQLKINVKLFLRQSDANEIKKAIDFTLSQLGIVAIDSLTISFPSFKDKNSIDCIKPLWDCLEEIVNQNLVNEIGVSDLDVNELTSLFNYAKKIKPCSNQINLDYCCTIPEEMKEFANNNNIRLLTHSDPIDILPIDRLHSIFKNIRVFGASNYLNKWVARYTIMSKGKGIVKNKGYIYLFSKI